VVVHLEFEITISSAKGREYLVEGGLNWLKIDPLSSFYENGHRPWIYVNCSEFLDWPSDYVLLRKGV
jgi:hypothetical protein